MSGARPSTVASYVCDELNGCVASTTPGSYATNGECYLNCPADHIYPVSKTVWRAADFGLDNDPHSTRPRPPRHSAAKVAQTSTNPHHVPSYVDTFCGARPLQAPWRGDAHLNVSLRQTPDYPRM
jgi:hypothetical protein